MVTTCLIATAATFAQAGYTVNYLQSLIPPLSPCPSFLSSDNIRIRKVRPEQDGDGVGVWGVVGPPGLFPMALEVGLEGAAGGGEGGGGVATRIATS